MTYALDMRAPAEIEAAKAAVPPIEATSPWSDVPTVADAIPLDTVEIQDEDKDLLDRLATGDEVAFRLLVERHVDRAYAIALRIVGNAADAEDVVQDTMLKV